MSLWRCYESVFSQSPAELNIYSRNNVKATWPQVIMIIQPIYLGSEFSHMDSSKLPTTTDGHQQFFIVQLIQIRKQAENFSGHWHRLTWEAMPHSIHERIATTIMNNDCLVFGILFSTTAGRKQIHQVSTERLRKSFYPQATMILNEDTA